MDNNTIIVLISVGVNVGIIAYSYGKLSQKVSDLCRRIKNTETQVDGIAKWISFHSCK